MPHPRDRRRQFQPRVTAPPITLTAQAREVLRLLEQTRDPVFVTGRAGTGKSTLLQYFRATTAKKLAGLFNKNFETYAPGASAEVKAAAPKA